MASAPSFHSKFWSSCRSRPRRLLLAGFSVSKWSRSALASAGITGTFKITTSTRATSGMLQAFRRQLDQDDW
eukprot:7747451-Pyramimonas_sp.AAC.1